MVQFSNLLNNLSKKNPSNRSSWKNSKLGVGRKAAAGELAKDAKRNKLVLTTSECKNFAAGCSKQGKKGLNNQDCFLVWEEFGCQEDTIFCGVFDGHGPWGHLVAKAVRELMPSSLLCNWQEAVALNPLSPYDNSLETDDRDHSQLHIWRQSFFKTCADIDQELKQHPGIDSFYSGTTALALVKQGDDIIVANVGDSRAVLATISNDGSMVATQLTVDLKPNLPHESKRIAQSRGRVYSCPDEPGVHSVWMPNGEGPGLALSRAFGDYYIKDFGLISEPEVTRRCISSRDQFTILATDGVWDVLSNQEAVDIVASTAERAKSAKRLVESAVNAWKQKGRATARDDISAICLFFHHLSTPALDRMKLNQKCM